MPGFNDLPFKITSPIYSGSSLQTPGLTRLYMIISPVCPALFPQNLHNAEAAPPNVAKVQLGNYQRVERSLPAYSYLIL